MMLQPLIQVLVEKHNLRQEDVLLLETYGVTTAEHVAEHLRNKSDRELVLTLCRLLASSAYSKVQMDFTAARAELGPLLKSPDWKLRQATVRAVIRLYDEAYLETLLEMARDNDEVEMVRVQILCDFVLWNTPVIIPVVSALALDRQQPLIIREAATEALSINHHTALTALRQLLQDELPEIRYCAVLAANNLHNPIVTPDLEPLLNDHAMTRSGETIAELTQSVIKYLRLENRLED